MQVLSAAEHAATQPIVRGLDYLDSDDPAKVGHTSVSAQFNAALQGTRSFVSLRASHAWAFSIAGLLCQGCV